MRNRLKVTPTYEVKLGDVAQLAGDALVVQSLKDLKKLDIFAQKLVAKWRNEPAPII
ncbi:hypothetical protein ACT4UT_35715, partial [Bacillus sp. B-TM1]